MRRALLCLAFASMPAALPAQDFGSSRCVMVVDTMLRYRRVEVGTSLTFYANGHYTFSADYVGVSPFQSSTSNAVTVIV